jgi:hypothetical protein
MGQNVAHVCPLHAAAYPHSLAVADDNDLTLGARRMHAQREREKDQ